MPYYGPWITPDPYDFTFDVPDATALPAGGGYDMPADPADARGILEASRNSALGTFNRLESDPSPDDADWVTVVESPPFPSNVDNEVGDHAFVAGFDDTVSRSNFLSTTPASWQLWDIGSTLAVFVALADRPPTTLPAGAVSYELESDGLTQPDRITATVLDLVLSALTTLDNGPSAVATDATIYRWATGDLAGPDPAAVRAVVEPFTILDIPLAAEHVPAATAAAKTVISVESVDETTTGTWHVVVTIDPADWNDTEFAVGIVSSWALTHTRPPLPNAPTPSLPTGEVRQLIYAASAQIRGTYQPRRYRLVYDYRPPLAHRQRRDGTATAGPQLAHIGTTGGRPSLAHRQHTP